MPSARFLSLLLVCLASGTLAAQTSSTPSGPFPAPVTGYVGRYLDSATTADFQSTPGYPVPRTYRAKTTKIAPEHDAIYMIIGSTFVRQQLSTFAHRTATETMLQLTSRQAPPGERYLAFDDSTDPEQAPFWITSAYDGQDRLYDFDWDDRGFIYLATGFGLGIVDNQLDLVHQFTQIYPGNILTFRNGESYYAVFDGADRLGIMDVTNPSSALSVPGHQPLPNFYKAAKTTDGYFAFITNSDTVTIHSTATLLAGSAPVFTLPDTSSTYYDITSDGTRFYVLGIGATGTIHVLTPSGGTFVDTTLPAPARSNTTIDYGMGYLVVGSQNPRRAAIYSVASGTPTLQGDLLTDYYSASYGGNIPSSFIPVLANGEAVLIAAMRGVGDVFSLTPPPPLTIEQQFVPPTVVRNDPSTLTITIANPNATPVGSFNFSHAFPADLVNTATAASTTCGGTLTATTAGSSFALTNAAIGANANCTITLHLTSNVAGSFTSNIAAGAIISPENTNTASSATVTMIDGPLPFYATAVSTSAVSVNWPAVAGASGYELHRSALNSEFELVTTTSDTTYLDSGLVPNRTYVYKVRAIVGDVAGPFSNVDAATTTMFTDTSLLGVAAKAVHLTELRTAVNAMRAAKALGAATFNDDPVVAQSTSIQATHITELRTALDAARAAIGLTALTYTDPSVTAGTTMLKAVHVTELRGGTQ